MRKIIRPIALALAMLLLLSACSLPEPIRSFFHRGDDVDTTNAVTVYRLNNTDTRPEADLLQAELCSADDGYTADIGGLLAIFCEAPEDENLLCAVPEGVSLTGWNLVGGIVTVEFSAQFTACPASQQTLTACAVMLTLCSLETVKAVTVVSGGQTLFSELVPEDVITSGTESDPYTRQLRLFFTDSTGRRLVSEYHSLTLSEEASPERYVMEELLRGPNSDDLYSAIPAGTKLLSCTTEDHLCTVDLSEEFYTDRPDSALGERLAIYSIVNSLTALSDVDSVQILVEGSAPETYSFRTLSSPLEWYDEAIDTGSSSAYAADVTLYIAVPDLSGLAAFPCRLSTTDSLSRPEQLLSILLNFEEPGYPVLFSGTAFVNSVSVTGMRCTIDLSESFFSSLPEQARSLAVQAIVSTLCSLSEVSYVAFTISGQPAVFDGVDWFGPWNDESEIEVY